jgi:hypothetical protein
MREFNQESEKLATLKDSIRSFVSIALKKLLQPDEFARDWMKALARHCTPTRAQRANQLRVLYRKQLATALSSRKYEKWLLNRKNVTAKIVKHQTPKSDPDYWGSDFIAIWSATFVIHANNLEKRLEHDKQVTPADFAKEIRNEFRKIYGNVRFIQVTRASLFAAEFSGQPASMAQPNELPI